MNWDIIEGKWKQFSGEVQTQWGKLTNDDLDVIAGNKEKLAGKLQERYGWSKEEARRADREVEKLTFQAQRPEQGRAPRALPFLFPAGASAPPSAHGL
jgi:uncharacterized protein YjbJ (UPF0337 family)